MAKFLCTVLGHSWVGVEESILQCRRCDLFWDEDIDGPFIGGLDT